MGGQIRTLRRRRSDATDATGELVEALRREQNDILEVAAADTQQPVAALRPALRHIFIVLAGSQERAAEVETFRKVGAKAARDGSDGGDLLDRYLSLNWAAWEAAVRLPESDRDVIVELGDRLLRGIDRAIAAMVDGYRQVTLERAAKRASRHRAILEEILGSGHATPEECARVRHYARKHGIRPDSRFQLITVAVPIRNDAEIDDMVDRLDRALSIPSGGRQQDPAIHLPQVLEWRGLIVILARARWTGAVRIRDALSAAVGDGWIAVHAESIRGIELLPEAVAQADYALDVAGRLGRCGWLGDPTTLSLESTFLLDERLVHAAITQELGPVLDDERMGETLVKTLHVFLDSRQSITETAKRLELAPRTVANHLARVETLLGRSLADCGGVRIGAALMALEVTRKAGES